MSAQRCLVFGGSGALGSAVCAALGADGARVAFTYHEDESAARVVAEGLTDAVGLRLDATSIEAVESAVDTAAEALGGIDAFVQCAGVGVTTTLTDARTHAEMEAVDERAWDRMMAVNAKSTFFAVRRLARVMAGGGGNVVLVGSVDGVKPVPSPVHYAASKGALAGMTAAMAKELGKSGIRVNMVAPGIMDGGMSRDIPASLLQQYVKHCGLRRVGRTGEIARVVGWLALHNTYVTGQVVLVDGAL